MGSWRAPILKGPRNTNEVAHHWCCGASPSDAPKALPYWAGSLGLLTRRTPLSGTGIVTMTDNRRPETLAQQQDTQILPRTPIGPLSARGATRIRGLNHHRRLAGVAPQKAGAGRSQFLAWKLYRKVQLRIDHGLPKLAHPPNAHTKAPWMHWRPKPGMHETREARLASRRQPRRQLQNVAATACPLPQ